MSSRGIFSSSKLLLLLLPLMLLCARARAKGLPGLGLDECLKLFAEHNVRLKISQIAASMAGDAHDQARNCFNPAFSLEYSTSSRESGGASAESALYGTKRDQRRLEMSIGEALKTGGELSLSYIQDEEQTNSAFSADTVHGASVSIEWRQPLFKSCGTLASLYRLRASRLSLEHQGLVAAATVLSLQHRMVEIFFDCLRKQLLLQVSEKSLETNETLYRATQSRLALGLASKLDLLESDLRLAEARGNVAKCKSDLDTSLGRLALAAGTGLCQDRRIRFPLDFNPRRIDCTRAEQIALARRIDLKLKENELRRRRLDLRFSLNEDKPDISLTTSYDKSGEGSSLADAHQLDDQSYSVAIQYTTRFGPSDEHIELSIKRKALDLARLEVENMKTDIKIAVAEAVRRLNNAARLVGLRKKQAGLAEERFKFTRIAYENEIKSMLNLLQAEEVLTTRQSDYMESIVDFFLARANLLKTLGQPVTMDGLVGGLKECVSVDKVESQPRLQYIKHEYDSQAHKQDKQ